MYPDTSGAELDEAETAASRRLAEKQFTSRLPPGVDAGRGGHSFRQGAGPLPSSHSTQRGPMARRRALSRDPGHVRTRIWLIHDAQVASGLDDVAVLGAPPTWDGIAEHDRAAQSGVRGGPQCG